MFVDFFGVGVERISAWIFESFQTFAKNGIRQGNKVCEQIRNRLMERFLYLLPNQEDGKIISSEDMFELEVAKFKTKISKSLVVIDLKIGRGKKPTKTVTFAGFSISNKFPDNVLLMQNNSVVVCFDILKDSNSDVLQIGVKKFSCLESAFEVPYDSSRFSTFLGSKLSETVELFNVNNIKGKMFAVPFAKEDCSKLPNILTCPSTKWFLTPIRHTLREA